MTEALPFRTPDTAYIIHTRVVKLERHFRTWFTGVGDTAIRHDDPIGWFIQFAGSSESIFLGNDMPTWKVGDPVTIRMERRHDPE
jgi:hypothetical protein